MKRLFLLFILVLATGCNNFFERPPLNPDQFRDVFLNHISAEEIESLDYYYHGAIGGYQAVARVKAPTSSLKKILEGAKEDKESYYRESFYGGENDKIIKELVMKTVKNICDGKIPLWMDFSELGRIKIYKKEYTENYSQSYHWTYFYDEDRGIIYFIGMGE